MSLPIPVRNLSLGFLCVIAVAGCGSGNLDDLQGSWKAVSVDMEGAPLTGKVARQIEVSFTKPDHVLIVTDGETHKGSCELDTTTDPKRVLLKPADGNVNDRPLYAIFALDREKKELHLCLSHRRYPPGFATKPGYDYVLVRLKQKQLTEEVKKN